MMVSKKAKPHRGKQPTMRSSKKLARLRTLVSLFAMLPLANCAQMMDFAGIEPKGTVTVSPDSFCLIAQPITWSTKDTDQTIEQVKEHNAVFKRLCRGKN